MTAAVLAFLHAVASGLGAVGMGLAADQADPISTDEASLLALGIAVLALAMVVAAILLLVGHSWPVLAVAGVSLLISLYIGVRWAGDPSGYQIPLIFAVLPLAVVAIVGTGLRRRSGALAVR